LQYSDFFGESRGAVVVLAFFDEVETRLSERIGSAFASSLVAQSGNLISRSLVLRHRPDFVFSQFSTGSVV